MTVKPGWARKRDRLRRREAELAARHQSTAMKIITSLVRRLRAKKITIPVLLIVGAVLGVAALGLYLSAAAQVAGPVVPWVGIQSKVAIAEITYSVAPVSSGKTSIDIKMQRDSRGPAAVSRTVVVNMTPGRQLGMMRMVTFPWAGQAAVHFTVNAAESGMNLNGTTAAVAIPRIVYLGPGTPALIVTYPIPSTSGYDWSSLQPAGLIRSNTTFIRHTVKADVGVQAQASTPGQVVEGVNHARQANDTFKIFIAGTLLGLAGGALVSALQEWLHARDSRDTAATTQGHPAR